MGTPIGKRQARAHSGGAYAGGAHAGRPCWRASRLAWLMVWLPTLASVWCGLAGVAQAQNLADRLRVRLNLGAAAMVSFDQVDRMGFDTGGIVGGAQLGLSALPWLQGQATLAGAIFPTPNTAGALLAPALGVGVNTTSQGLRVYTHLDVGAGFTGKLLRPFVRVAVGVDLRISDAIMLGPVIGFDQVIQHDVPAASTDARFLWLGVSFTLRPFISRPEVPSPTTQTRTQVVTRHIHSVEREPAEPSPELLSLIDDALPATQVQVHIQLLAPVLFDLDSDALQPIGVAMLHEVQHELAQRPELELVEIQGAADQRGSSDYNIELSARRAQRVFDWLVAHGIAAERLQVAAHGSSAPIESGDDEAQHEQNRRVVFRVLRVKEPTP